MNKIIRHAGCEVSHMPGGFQVREVRTQEIRCVALRIRSGKRTPGCCSCGNAAAELPVFQCRHQRAAAALLRQEDLSSLAQTGGSSNTRSGSAWNSMRNQRRLLHAFSRAQRAGPPPCPHCGEIITAEDLDDSTGFTNRFRSTSLTKFPH